MLKADIRDNRFFMLYRFRVRVPVTPPNAVTALLMIFDITANGLPILFIGLV